MAKRQKDPFHSLAALPGGNDQYLITLVAILTWLHRTKTATRADFTLWLNLRTSREVHASSVNNYLQTLGRLKVIDINRRDQLALTPFGQQILEATEEGRVQLLMDYLLRHFRGLSDVLAFYAQATDEVHLDQVVLALQQTYPNWTGTSHCTERTRWSLSLHCLQQVDGRVYEITEQGRASLQRFLSASEVKRNGTPVADLANTDDLPMSMHEDVAELVRELEAAAIDSSNYRRLERIVARIFRFLGYEVHKISGQGDTDLVLQARIGPGGHSIICDTKSQRDGKFDQLDVYTLEEHRRKNQADHIVVIAAAFAGGKTRRHAEELGVVLLSVPVLVKWLKCHAETTLNLDEYHAFFRTPGLVADVPPSVQAAFSRHQRQARLLKDIIRAVQLTYEHGLNLRLPGDQLVKMVTTRERDMHYTEGEVRSVLALLTNPALCCAVGNYEDGICLLMNLPTVCAALDSLARQLQAAVT